MGKFIDIEFAGIAPRAAADRGRVTITYPRFTLAGLFRYPRHRAEIELSRALTWTVRLVGGGASGVTVLRRPGIPAELQVGGGVTRLTFDGERYGAIADFTRLESDDRDRQPGHYEIEILGGASDLTIAEEGPWHA